MGVNPEDLFEGALLQFSKASGETVYGVCWRKKKPEVYTQGGNSSAFGEFIFGSNKETICKVGRFYLQNVKELAECLWPNGHSFLLQRAKIIGSVLEVESDLLWE